MSRHARDSGIVGAGLAGALTLALGWSAVPALAQSSADPARQISNARLTARAAASPLAREIEAAAARNETGWIAYRIPMATRGHQMCSSWSSTGAPQILLEPPTEMTVLVRVESRQVVRVQTATPECGVDAGGLPVLFLTGVTPADSVDWLANQVRVAPSQNRGGSRLLEPSLAALAWHPGDAAVRAMIAFARQDSRPSVRSKALFWLGQRAGQEAVAAIGDAVNQDSETAVKKKAVFALSQLPADQGVPLLINVARSHANRDVRKQAMFWLGQSKDPRAISFFEEVLTSRR